MRIVTTSKVFAQEISEEETLLRLEKLGFDGIDLDLSVEKMHPFWQDGWEDYVKKLAQLAQAHRISYTHSHLPGDANLPETVYAHLLKIAGMLGIRYAVLHPIWRGEDGEIIYDWNTFIQINASKYRMIAEEAGKNGVTLLGENLLWGASIYPQVQSKLVETVDSPWFGWCFDTGHAHIFDISMTDVCGLNRIPVSLHVHDNYGGKPGDIEKEIASWHTDEHQLMGDGTVDWKNFLTMLKKSGYSGEFVLEANHQARDAANIEEAEAILVDLLSRAKKMVAYFETL